MLEVYCSVQRSSDLDILISADIIYHIYASIAAYPQAVDVEHAQAMSPDDIRQVLQRIHTGLGTLGVNTMAAGKILEVICEVTGNNETVADQHFISFRRRILLLN